jgi:hypothetical protein
MPSSEKKVPATPANCEKDRKAKEKLKYEFKDFERLLLREGKESRDVQKLLKPFERLKAAIKVGAYGVIIVPPPPPPPPPPPKNKGKVSTARATHRAGRRK